LHIHELKENNRGAEASTLSMGSYGQMAMNTQQGFFPSAQTIPGKVPSMIHSSRMSPVQ
jgi:hypothetical protein